MNIFGYYIEKKYIFYGIIILLVILICIISVNIRISNDKKEKEENKIYQGYESDDGESPNGAALVVAQVSIYDFDKIMPYFSDTAGALEFKDYLNDYLIEEVPTISEWWIDDISFDEDKLELSFYARSNEKEYFYIVKNNDETTITHVKAEQKEV